MTGDICTLVQRTVQMTAKMILTGSILIPMARRFVRMKNTWTPEHLLMMYLRPRRLMVKHMPLIQKVR